MTGHHVSLDARGEQRPPLPSAVHWITRGLLVGLIHGVAAGTMIPVFGNIVGGYLGAKWGLGLGAAMTGLSAVTRWFSPVDREGTEIRERLLVLTLIAVAFVVLAMSRGSRLSFLPALPGLIHSCLAGTPTGDRPFEGEVSPRRTQLINSFPIVIGLVMLFCFLIGVVPDRPLNPNRLPR